jgi:hypothetical protein
LQTRSQRKTRKRKKRRGKKLELCYCSSREEEGQEGSLKSIPAGAGEKEVQA